ncbi:hypothetical protein ES703_48670 [subsurface metagenome]
MVRIEVELYKPPVSPIFDGLPGYTMAKNHSFDINEFWTVVIPKPVQGTEQAKWIAPIPADSTFNIDTMGTDPLPATMQELLVASVCIKNYKHNPYTYKIHPPQGPTLGPVPESFPPIVRVPPPYLCRKLEEAVSGIGIWIVGLISAGANKLPTAPSGRETVFEPSDSIPGVEHAIRQPYIVLSDDSRPKYVTYYDCTGWNSEIEIMNLQNSEAECKITIYSRTGNTAWEQILSLKPQETKRILLDQYASQDEGLIVVEPVKSGWEFPTTLMIKRVSPWPFIIGRPQFVPFTRIP